MQARRHAIGTKPYLEICLHDNDIPHWQWQMNGPDELLDSLCGSPRVSFATAPHDIRQVGPDWRVVAPDSAQWIREQLLRPMIDHIDRQLAFTPDDVVSLPQPLSTLRETLVELKEQALRDYLFTDPTPCALFGRWMRDAGHEQPATARPEVYDCGMLEVYAPNRTDLVLIATVQRWKDGLHWISDLRDSMEGAFVPGPLMMALDCLPTGISQRLQWSQTPPAPELLPTPLVEWLRETIMWGKDPTLSPENYREHMLDQARELSPDQPGQPGKRYSRHIAYARIVQERSIVDLDL